MAIEYTFSDEKYWNSVKRWKVNMRTGLVLADIKPYMSEPEPELMLINI